MNRFFLRLLFVILSGLMGANHAQSAFVFGFTPDGSAASFSVDAGQSITLSLYLSGDARLTSQGLYSSGVTVNYGYDSGAGDAVSGNASISQAALDFHWTNTALNYTDINNAIGSQYAVLEGVVAGPPVTPVKPAVGTDYVRLGTITLDAGQAGNVTRLSLSNDLNLAFINLLHNAGSGDALDGQITFSGATLTTITSVPEPSSLVTLSLVFCTLYRLKTRVAKRVS